MIEKENRPFYEPENRTKCPETGGKHQWVWVPEQDDYQCDECGVLESNQEEG